MDEDTIKSGKDPDKKHIKEKHNYDTIKLKLKNIIKFKNMIPIIKKRINITNEIWTEAYFLFNLLILNMMKNNQKIVIDYSLLERCVLFVLNRTSRIKKSKKINDKKNDMEYMLKELTKSYVTDYVQLGDNCLTKYDKIKSIGKPFEYLSRQAIVNMKNHVQMNFTRFQKKYLMARLLDFFNQNKMKKNLRHSVTSFIQYHINNNTNKLSIKSERIKKLLYSDLELYIKIINMATEIIPCESNKLPTSLKGKINKTNLKNNFTDGLKYYYLMIDYLEKNEVKRFPLLPQFTFKNKYIKFDSRLLSTIYNEWVYSTIIEIYESNKQYIKHLLIDGETPSRNIKQKYCDLSNPEIYNTLSEFDNLTGISNSDIENIIFFKKENAKYIKSKYNIPDDCELNQIGIKEFEKNYAKYYKKCFNFGTIGGSNNNPISFMSNGYSICVLFEKPFSIKKEPIDKINLDEYQKGKKFKKGLFDADNVYGSQEFLDKYHKIGIDPGNDVILYCQSESGKVIRIKKSYYNELSHITSNNRKVKKYIKQSDIKDVYKQLSSTNYKCSINISIYKKYIEIYRSNRDNILHFYRQNKYQSLELDTFINKKKAIHTIVRKIIPKNMKCHSFDNLKNKYVDDEIYNKVRYLPPLLAFGKGNGSITISNLKNSGSKGPVKTLAKELSRYCITIVTDEYNSSQYCNSCKDEKLSHPTVLKKISTRINGIKLKKEVNQEVYRLCYCKNNIHQTTTSVTGVHKIWNRDYNASKNILTIMKNKILGIPLGVFKRCSKKKPKLSGKVAV